MQVKHNFSARKLHDETLGKFWIEFQKSATLALPRLILSYMQNTINSGRKREGGTGKLAKSMDIWRDPNTVGQIHWGIGSINKLNNEVPYWYVINYGKTIGGQAYIPNYGNFVPGSFRGGDGHPRADLIGKGTEHFDYGTGSKTGMFPKSSIRPINYIEKTRFKLNQEIKKLLNKLKRFRL